VAFFKAYNCHWITALFAAGGDSNRKKEEYYENTYDIIVTMPNITISCNPSLSINYITT
jgi:hypothetical protein